MTCQEFWNTMPELEGGGGESARSHLRNCPACAAIVDGHQALSAGLRKVASDDAGVQAPRRVEGVVLASFRGQNGLAVERPRSRWWSPLAGWSTAAAVLAAAVLLIVVRTRVPEPASPYAANETAAIDWTAGLPMEQISENSEGEFIPLPNAERLPQDEHYNLVRVELPRTAMIALGYSVTADRAQEKVQADIVLGSDGLARAVRFLDE